MAAAAEAFFRAAHVASHRIRDWSIYAIDVPEFRGITNDFAPSRLIELRDSAVGAIDEAQAREASIFLFFGPKSQVSKEAEAILGALRALANELREAMSGVPDDFASEMIKWFRSRDAFAHAVESALNAD